MRPSHAMIAMLPCNDLDASETFYNRLGFSRVQRDGGPLEWENDYRILTDRRGGELHLTRSVDDWLVPGRNPFGLYLYTDDVDAVAAAFASELAGKRGPEEKPWGTYEFALADPDQTLVRVGRRLQP
jgi:catechol 2,3-dioxygenase-like lactoylglutathione lyase family enzyme